MRISFSGSQGVGKTTLVNELKKKPQFTKYKFFTERSKYLSEMGVPLNDKSTFKGQIMFMAERARELMEPNMITDRSSIDVTAFTETSDIDVRHKAGLSFLLFELAKEYDIIFYVPPVIKMKDNGIRHTDLKYRKLIDENIRILLNNPALKDKVYIIQKTKLKDRVDEVIKTFKKMK